MANSTKAAPRGIFFRHNFPLQLFLVCMIYSLGQVALGLAPKLQLNQINCSLYNLI